MTERRFEVLGTVTWVGDDSVRPVGSTGKVRELRRVSVYVDWGYDPDVPRDEQPEAEGWCVRADLRPGFVAEEEARTIAGLA
jgi:hypothetical protein